MSSILIATVPIHGHVTPMLAVARHFAERGDRVRFITGSRFADAVSRTGAEFLPLPPLADFDDRLDLNERFPERVGLKGSASIAFDIEQIFMAPARHSMKRSWRRTEPSAPTCCSSIPPSRARRSCSAIRGPSAPPWSCAACSRSPSPAATPRRSAWASPRWPAAWADSATPCSLRSRDASSRPPSEAPTRCTASVHGVDMPGAILDWSRRAEAIAQFTVAEFEYPRSDAPDTLHFVGPISASGSTAPRPDWWGDLDGSKPVVHVTQGTIANKDFGQLVGPTLEALADEDVLVVVATGGRPLDTLPPLPANARAAEYLPYDELLPKTDVYVTNAGYGGVQYALRYGVPIVASGGQEDKPEVGARIAWSGVGRRFRAISPQPKTLRRAIRSVLHDERYQRAARAVADRMAAAGGFSDLAAIVDRLAQTAPRATRRPTGRRDARRRGAAA